MLIQTLLVSVLIVRICFAAGASQTEDAPTIATRTDLTKRFAFTNYCRTGNMVGGVEEAKCSEIRDEKSSSLNAREATFRNFLNQTRKEHPTYAWSIKGGIVNLFPLKRNGPDLLGKKLEKVSINHISGFEAFFHVLDQAAIKANPGGSGGYGAGVPAQKLISLELKDVTVRDALNAIAKADGHVVWWYCPTSSDKSEVMFDLDGWITPNK